MNIVTATMSMILHRTVTHSNKTIRLPIATSYCINNIIALTMATKTYHNNNIIPLDIKQHHTVTHSNNIIQYQQYHTIMHTKNIKPWPITTMPYHYPLQQWYTHVHLRHLADTLKKEQLSLITLTCTHTHSHSYTYIYTDTQMHAFLYLLYSEDHKVRTGQNVLTSQKCPHLVD